MAGDWSAVQKPPKGCQTCHKTLRRPLLVSIKKAFLHSELYGLKQHPNFISIVNVLNEKANIIECMAAAHITKKIAAPAAGLVCLDIYTRGFLEENNMHKTHLKGSLTVVFSSPRDHVPNALVPMKICYSNLETCNFKIPSNPFIFLLFPSL